MIQFVTAPRPPVLLSVRQGGPAVDDDWKWTEADEAEYRKDRQRRDREERASRAANRATWWTWAALTVLLAPVFFATDDVWGNPRGMAINLFLAFVLGPAGAGVVVAMIADVVIGPIARSRTAPRPLSDFPSPPTRLDETVNDRLGGADALNWREERYGEQHQALRAAWARIIESGGGECKERICIHPNGRRIPPGSFFHLAHDHERGGRHAYLGPAHPECNEAEALRRGVTWEGAPSLTELLAQAADKASDPSAVEASQGDERELWDDEADEGRHYPRLVLDGSEVIEPRKRVANDPWAPPGYSDGEPRF